MTAGATAYVALLRAVNVGGRNLVPMPALRDLAAQIGLKHPRTLLQSGNLLFDDDRHTALALEKLLAEAIAQRLGLTTEVIVRSASQWRDAIAQNPLPVVAVSAPTRLVMVCFGAEVTQSHAVALMAAVKGRETVRAAAGQLYVSYPDGIGRSKLTTAVIDRLIGAPGTARNWATVLKIAALLDS